MSKISIEEVEVTLLKQKVDPKIVITIIKELTEVIEEAKEDRDTTPKQKNEFLIVLSDPNNDLAGKEFTGWVIQQKQGDDAGLALDKIKEAARATNEAKKRKKNMITTMADAFYATKRFFLKSKNIMVKTKEPIRVLVTDGRL